jgi:uncharacterized OB-fold protein
MFVPPSGCGVVYSFTIVYRASSAAFEADVPYIIVLVNFSEGFRMMMNLRNWSPEVARIGLPVKAIFEDCGQGLCLPQVEPSV